jgi:DeoR family fructose operon transcriptional repressor
LVTRTHGGAVARHRDVLSPERGFPIREAENAAQKRGIAACALPLVVPGSTVIMDASTTVLSLARILPPDIDLNVIVNALPIASELSNRPNVTLTLLGGTVRRTSYSSTGPLAEASLRRIFADTCFISVRGLSLQRGLTEANPAESALKELMIANSSRVVALVDSTKLGQTAFSLFAPVSAIDVLVTDSGADEGLLGQLRDLGLQVDVAD